jgi:hypothetical protein
VVLPHSGCCRVDDLLGICLAAVQLRRLPASEGPTPCAQLVLSGVMKQSSGKTPHLHTAAQRPVQEYRGRHRLDVYHVRNAPRP